MRLFAPQCEKHRTFQDESIAVRRLAKTIEPPLQAIAVEHVLQLLALFFSYGAQPVAYGGREVGQCFAPHQIASR